MSALRILFVGDIVGAPGRAMFQKHIDKIRKENKIDAVIVNGENSSHGKGITSRIVDFFKHNGVDIITSGNHIWHVKEIYSYLENNKDLLRPANYPSLCPGSGFTIFVCQGYQIGIINLQGRVFMRETIDCPFRTVDSILSFFKPKTKLIFVDFHAEATAEKISLANYLDGRISGLVGTHTHVQTADERILPKGSAFITDLGMTGALDSAIGVKKDIVIKRFLTQMPARLEVENKGPMIFNAAWIEVDVSTGKAYKIERVSIVDDEINI